MNVFSKVLICILLMSSCTEQPQKKENMEKEDLMAKEWLQGTWIDDMTETPLFTAKGDTIYYIDEPATPVAFKIIKDTLKTYGQKTANYHIKKQGQYFIWIQSFMGDILQLSKAEHLQDSLWIHNLTPEKTTEEVISKDKIVYYNNQRFRGYVYINPTDIKIHQLEITEEGLEIVAKCHTHWHPQTIEQAVEDINNFFCSFVIELSPCTDAIIFVATPFTYESF